MVQGAPHARSPAGAGSSPRLPAAWGAAGLAWALATWAATEQLALPTARGGAWAASAVGFVIANAALLQLLARRAEVRARRFAEPLRAALDALGDAVLVVDAEGVVVEANAAARALTGLADAEAHLVPLKEWARRTGLRLRAGDAVPPERLAALSSPGAERPGGWEAVVRRPDGTDYPVAVSGAPVTGRPGGPRLAVVVLRDESEAVRLAQTREEFLATAAHELKTPLSVIKAHAQLLLRRPEAEPGLQVIVRQVDRLTRLAQQVLDASRLRLDTAELRWEPLELGDLVADVVGTMGPEPGGHRLQFERAGPARVRADRGRMERVVSALVDNALRFSPPERPVEVRVGTRGGEAIFSVLDHGVGIPPDRQERVFERYYRAHAGTPEDRGGLGVGLDTCREIVARHGGRMWFQSEPGTGSTFLFALPLAPEAPP